MTESRRKLELDKRSAALGQKTFSRNWDRPERLGRLGHKWDIKHSLQSAWTPTQAIFAQFLEWGTRGSLSLSLSLSHRVYDHGIIRSGKHLARHDPRHLINCVWCRIWLFCCSNCNVPAERPRGWRLFSQSNYHASNGPDPTQFHHSILFRNALNMEFQVQAWPRLIANKAFSRSRVAEPRKNLFDLAVV